MLRVRDLAKVFRGRHGRDVHALRGVSIDVGPNESVGIVGESGSGKTTLARCLVGLEVQTSGTIEVAGVLRSDAGKHRRARRASACTSSVQIVFQDPYSSLDPKQSVGGAIAETLRANGYARGGVDARVRELFDQVGLTDAYIRRLPSALSGGERQRVAIARALAVEPRLIIFDEPVSALDVSVQAQVLNLLSAAAPRARAELPVHHARPRGRPPGRRARVRLPSWPRRRERPDRPGARAAAARVHANADRIDPAGLARPRPDPGHPRRDHQMNLELLRAVSNAPGLSGFEDAVQQVAIESLTASCDEVWSDRLNNVIGLKRAVDPVLENGRPRRVVLAAHADEIGMMVKHVDDNGFIRFHPVGGIHAPSLISQQVLIHGRETSAA